MGVPSSESTLARRALWLVGAYLVAQTVATAYTQAALWDFEALQEDLYDQAWRLELALRASHGEWSGRDFDYPRGPLWQGVAYLASLLSSGWAAGTLAWIYLLFHAASLAIAATATLRFVPSGWARVGALAALATLTNGSGPATFRAVLSLGIVLAYAPPESAVRDAPRRRWVFAGVAAAATLGALLLSFDRASVAALSFAGVFVVEVIVRARHRDEPLEAVRRPARFVVCLAVGAALVIAVGAWLGFHPLDYLEGQRRLASAYAANMVSSWEVDVPPSNVIALVVAGGALIAPSITRAGSADRSAAVWLGGALPAAAFGLIRSDAGHVFMAILPALGVLVLVAAGAGQGRSWTRLGAGVVAAAAMLGWFGTYPAAFSQSPTVFADAFRVATGLKRADRGFSTDHRVAARWAWGERRRGARCVGMSPHLTVAHALSGLRGPTELAMRWTPDMQAELARDVERWDCERFLYYAGTIDEPGESWFFGEDFVALAEQHRARRRLGFALFELERRGSREQARRAPIDVPEPQATELTLPADLVLPLSPPVSGEELVRLAYVLDFPRWRTFAGGQPRIDYRFETGGAPVTGWKQMHHMEVGRPSVVFLSPDPDTAELRWIAGIPRAGEPRRASSLRLRVTGPGVFAPDAVSLEVRSLERLSPPAAPRDDDEPCHAYRRLVDQLRSSAAWPRQLSPDADDSQLHLRPRPPGQPLGELLFPLRPCSGTCFMAEFEEGAPPGDAAAPTMDVEVHAIEGAARARLGLTTVPRDGSRSALELSLERWRGRPILLRVGVLGSAGVDPAREVLLIEPRLERCTARRSLPEGIASGRVTLSGAARASSETIEVGWRGGTLRRAFHVAPNTCATLGARAPRSSPRVVMVRVAEGGQEQVLHEGEIAGGDTWRSELGLHDWTGRRVELVVDLPAAATSGEPAEVLTLALHECGAAP
ncbi:MAG: hypothetical protein VYE22_37885 [Myxococcota bacterium]|nr:hypothetical protein [Myxococcota bacterium]